MDVVLALQWINNSNPRGGRTARPASNHDVFSTNYIVGKPAFLGGETTIALTNHVIGQSPMFGYGCRTHTYFRALDLRQFKL